MGAAARQRGDKAIRETIQQGQRPVEFELIDRMNNIPKRPDAGTPFAPIVFASNDDGWWDALDAKKMWRGNGYRYKTLAEAVSRWNVEITGIDTTSGRTILATEPRS